MTHILFSDSQQSNQSFKSGSLGLDTPSQSLGERLGRSLDPPHWKPRPGMLDRSLKAGDGLVRLGTRYLKNTKRLIECQGQWILNGAYLLEYSVDAVVQRVEIMGNWRPSIAVLSEL
jgi:hypothetical protein